MKHQTATNPETGEKIVNVDGEWRPIEASATNPRTGARAYQVDGQWVTEQTGTGRVGGAHFASPTTEGPQPLSAAEMSAVGKAPTDDFLNGAQWKQAGKNVLETAGGAVSGIGATVLGAGAGYIGEPLRYAGEQAASALGLKKAPVAPFDPHGVKEAIQNEYTYQPTSESGRKLAEVVGKPYTLLKSGVETVGNLADPAVGAAMGDFLDTAAAVLPLKGAGQLPGRAKLLRTAPEAVPGAITPRAVAAAERNRRAQIAADAQEAGASIPPTQARPNLLNAAVGLLTDKTKVEAQTALNNHSLVQAKAARVMDLPEGTPLTADVYDAFRKEQGQHYAAVKDQVKPFTLGAGYDSALAELAKPLEEAAKDVPHRAKDPALATIEQYRAIKQLRGDSAIEELKLLRADADKAFRSGDTRLGKVYRGVGKAIENELDSAAVKAGADPKLIENYRTARRRIAESYTLEGVTDLATGAVDMTKLAGKLAKGKLIPEPMKPLARAAGQFPKSFRPEAKVLNPAPSWGDWIRGGVGATAAAPALGPFAPAFGAAMVAASHFGPKLLASKIYQRTLGKAKPRSTKPAEAPRAVRPSGDLGTAAADRSRREALAKVLRTAAAPAEPKRSFLDMLSGPAPGSPRAMRGAIGDKLGHEEVNALALAARVVDGAGKPTKAAKAAGDKLAKAFLLPEAKIAVKHVKPALREDALQAALVRGVKILRDNEKGWKPAMGNFSPHAREGMRYEVKDFLRSEENQGIPGGPRRPKAVRRDPDRFKILDELHAVFLNKKNSGDWTAADEKQLKYLNTTHPPNIKDQYIAERDLDSWSETIRNHLREIASRKRKP